MPTPKKSRSCANCARILEGGRKDRKFCDDHCRITYHMSGKLNRAKLHAMVDRRVDQRVPEVLNKMMTELVKRVERRLKMERLDQ